MCVFAPNRGLVVGEGDALAFLLLRLLYEEFRGVVALCRTEFVVHVLDVDFLVLEGFAQIAHCLGNIPVLAEGAFEIAADCANGEDPCFGEKVVQRFLFHGVDMNSARASVNKKIQLAFLVEPDSALTHRILFYDATLAAAIAFHHILSFLAFLHLASFPDFYLIEFTFVQILWHFCDKKDYEKRLLPTNNSKDITEVCAAGSSV